MHDLTNKVVKNMHFRKQYSLSHITTSVTAFINYILLKTT